MVRALNKLLPDRLLVQLRSNLRLVKRMDYERHDITCTLILRSNITYVCTRARRSLVLASNCLEVVSSTVAKVTVAPSRNRITTSLFARRRRIEDLGYLSTD